MATGNQLFGKYKVSLLDDAAGYSWEDAGETIQAVAINTAVLTQSDIDAFEFIQDISDSSSYALAAVRSNAIAGRSVGSIGEANSNIITFDALTGADVFAFAIYRNVGDDDTTSTLIAYIDTGAGLSGGFSPGGGTTTVQPSSGSWFFKL